MGNIKKSAKLTKKAKTVKVTNEVTEASITKEKELKYIYPASCEEGKTKDEVLIRRKAFRQTVRKNIARFEKKLLKLEKAKTEGEKGSTTEFRKLNKELKAYIKEVHTPTYIAALK